MIKTKAELEKDLILDFKKTFYKKIGYIPTIVTQRKFTNNPLMTLDELEACFKDLLPKRYGKRLTLKGKCRYREIVNLRVVFAYMARMMDYKIVSIAKYLGGRDHTSVLHYIKNFYNLTTTDPSFRKYYANIYLHIKTHYEPNDELSAVVYFNKIQPQPESDIFSRFMQAKN